MPADVGPAVCLYGPTASGKSQLAMALAERFDIEIVSVDSAQVFRGMDIGTAKPSTAEQARVPHHLIDILDPVAAYSAAGFAADALRVLAEIRARGRLPLLVGGTMLYFQALRSGLDALPPADPAIREELERDAARLGLAALHARLTTLDPASAARIRPTDPQRIQRALEIIRVTGRPMSESLGARRPAPLDALWISLFPQDRASLHRAIAERFDAILAGGLVDELRTLRERYRLTPELPAMRAVGYRQAWRFLEGEIEAATLRETGIAATRQLAKRQLTWQRKLGGDLVLDAPDARAADRTLRAIDAFLAGSA